MGELENIWHSVLARQTAVHDNKKQKIIEATIALIAHQGIAAVTFENIGEQLKTTKANIKYHFTDKHELIFTAARLVVVNAQVLTAQLIEQAPTPDKKLAAVIDGAYLWFERFPDHVTVWIFFVYLTQVDREYADFFTQTREQGRRRLEGVLNLLPRSKYAQCVVLAEQIQNSLYGQLLALATERQEIRKNKKAVEAMITTLVRAQGMQWSHDS